MKLKSKLMAAAIALVAASGANAAITQSATGNGELFFTIYDQGADLSSTADDRAYVRDLGSLLNGGALNGWATSPSGSAAIPALSADKQGFSTIYSIGADANFSSFLTASTDTSRLKWNIAAVDSNGHDRVLVTAASIANPGQLTGFRSLGTTADVYLAAINPFMTGESAVLAGSDANISKWGANIGGKTTTAPMSFTTTAGLGDSLNFYLLSEKVSSLQPLTAVTQQQYMADSTTAMQWTLAANGDLTYAAAVPEPSEYALMLAGLGMLGFMARRRLNNRA